MLKNMIFPCIISSIMKNNELDISLIIPMRVNVPQLDRKLQQLKDYFFQKGLSSEVILLDNRHSANIQLLLSSDNAIVIRPANIASRKQSPSYIVGAQNSKGKWKIFTDADQIDNFQSLDHLLEALDPDYDVIKAYRPRDNSSSRLRHLGSTLANQIFNLGSPIKLKDIGCSLSAAKKDFFLKVTSERYSRFYAFLPFLLVAAQAKVKEFPISRHYSSAPSTYSFFTLILLTLNLVRLKFHLMLFK
jgi:Glycosyl transferase family 2